VIRLDGWKDIAAALGKSVSTVRRWEREYELPVRRIENSESVYAFREELDAWVREVGKTRRLDSDVAASRSGDVCAEACQFVVLRPRGLLLATAAALVAILSPVGFLSWRQSAPSPIAWRFGDSNLQLLDAAGNVTTVFELPFPIVPMPANDSRYGQYADLDGDGSKEFVFVTNSPEPSGKRLYCLNSHGKKLFEYQRGGSVTFGSETFGGPFVPSRLYVAHHGTGADDLWLISTHHEFFPSVLQRIDANGRVLAEYWTNGHIDTVGSYMSGGVRYMAVGSTNNETRRPQLTLLDYNSPSGSAPADDPKYLCSDCGAGEPVSVLLFARGDLWDWLDSLAVVSALKPAANGALDVVVHAGQVAVPNYGSSIDWTVIYRVRSDGKVDLEVGEDYRNAHRVLFDARFLGHPFGEQDIRQLNDVLTWDAGDFVPLNQDRLSRLAANGVPRAARRPLP
jgi:hypothetical protein